ncbi:hypothetical protein [Streptomyces sp. ME19-01-6]|uniref:hypothetical protein n=1 Tax=Streptomyces sp. ME19-01-6 TaxID=3028686 RepID=UPI00299FB6E2|nr:hypothetical protein [Streptomyces sp. ME19-01-6]MDX3230555.1 hypothetical protein [Streptomyces sp. ME19-01-6]
MSPALAFVLLVATGALAGWAATRAIRSYHRRQATARITRARDRARLPEQMHLLGHEPRWARRTLADIHALPTTKGDR